MYSASNLMERQRSNDKGETGDPLVGTELLVSPKF